MYCYDDYAKELKKRLRATNRIAREYIIKAKLTAKQQYVVKDTKAISFKLGDKVLLHDETLRRSQSKKLDYEQLLLVGPVPKSERTCHLTHKGICNRLPSTIQRSRPEKADGKTEQRLQGVSAGMSNFAATSLESLRRLALTRNHKEAYLFASCL